MMKKKIVCIVVLLLTMTATACEGAPTQKDMIEETEETETMETLSEERLEDLRKKIGEDDENEEDATEQQEDSSQTVTVTNQDSPISAEEEATARNFMTGIWLARTTDGMERYFVFTDGTSGHYLEQETGMGMGFTYEMQNDETAIFHFGDTESVDQALISWVSLSNAYVKWESGEIETFKVINGNPSAELKFYSNQELSEMALNYYEAKNGFRPTGALVMVDASENIFIQLYDESDGYRSSLDTYSIDRYTGIGKDLLYQEVDLTAGKQPSESKEKDENSQSSTEQTTEPEPETTAEPIEETTEAEETTEESTEETPTE